MDNIELKTAALSKLHEIITFSPGGGLWYIYALVWILVVLYFFYNVQNKMSLLILFIPFFLLYLMRPLMNLACLQDTIFGTLKRVYDIAFASELTFFFHAVFYLSGMLYFEFRKFVLKYMNLEFSIGWLLTGYFFYVLTANYMDCIFGSVVFQLFRLNLSIAYFNFSIYVNKYIEVHEKTRLCFKQLRAMSSVIYFSHFLLIYVIRVTCILIGIDYQSILTISCLLAWIILSIYSIWIVRHSYIKFFKIIYPI